MKLFSALLLTASLCMVSSCGEEPAPKIGTPEPAIQNTPAATPVDYKVPNPADLKAHVKIETDLGEIKVHLYDDTPLHRDNFLKLVKDGFFNGTSFHRVIPSFMIQGGDPNTKDPAKKATYGEGGPGYTIPAEILPNHFHRRGALSAARQGDQINPKRESSGSQFYIVQGQIIDEANLSNMVSQIRMQPGLSSFDIPPSYRAVYSSVGGAPFLDQQYTVFGEVVSGMEVVDEIAKLGPNQQDDPAGMGVPSKYIKMKASIIE